MDEKKQTALLNIIYLLIGRHHSGKVVLDEPSFELFELAKRINWAADDATLEVVLSELRNFNK